MNFTEHTGHRVANHQDTFSQPGPIQASTMRSAVSLTALCCSLLAAPAFAQEEAAASVLAQSASAGMASADEGNPIVVTGTRIDREGYDAPTPVNVATSADIDAAAPGNIADFVNTLPSIAGSTSPGSATGSLSGATAGINSISLRGLGAGRTLVLLNGQRSVASHASGLVDVNTFPQSLIDRVEVVTGGASAAYGSDAVGGVVNFILDTDFRGLELEAQGGITDVGDAESLQFTATAGFSLFDDRLHVIANAEYYDVENVNVIDREWGDDNFLFMNNPYYAPGNGRPQRYVGYDVGPARVTPGGLIVSGPLRGTYFGAIDPNTGLATTGQLTFGDNNGSWMIGGDLDYTSAGYVGVSSLLPGQERYSGFGRATFDLTDDIEIFGQYTYARDEGYSVYIQPINNGNLTIQQDNAFLPDSVRQDMIANNLTSITLGTSNAGFPPAAATNVREVFRTVVGTEGSFSLFGGIWDFDAYAQHGKAESNENLIYTWNNSRISAASDAVYSVPNDMSSPIVCRINVDANPDNDDPACVPMNRMGVGGVTQEALDYVLGTPTRMTYITQDVAALTFNTDIIDLPAGPLSVAFGAEYREEKIDGDVDPQYENGWQYGNYRVTQGSYDVREGFIELAVPVLDSLNLNAAGRITDYSTSGSVETWKVGATFRPLDDIMLRGTISHDIRAPNLLELFSAGTGRSNTVVINGGPVAYQQLATGNANLRPEVADSWTVGMVFTPTFIDRLQASIDYYEVDISDAIDSIEPQDVADLCYLQSIQEQCDAISTLPGGLLQIKLQPFNFSRQLARGLDFNLAYMLPVRIGGLDGDLTFRGSATHYIENLLDNGLDAPVDNAGANARGMGPPSWMYRVTAMYDADPIRLSVTGRGVSAGVYDNSFVECQFDCPLSTPDAITVNNNHIDGQFVLDTSFTYDLPEIGGLESAIQFTVLNLLDSDPAMAARGPTSNSAPSFAQTNPTYYDYLGRRYRLTLRVKY